MAKREVVGDRRGKRTEWGFGRAAVYRKDRVYVLSFHEELEEDEESVTQVLRWNGQWIHWLVDWSVSALCVLEKPELQVLTMGTGGRIHVKAVSGDAEEHVDESREGPEYRGMLRDMRRIGDHVYVTGIGRQVYRRVAAGRWERRDAGAVVPRGRTRGTGFNSIDGFSENEIYAVGGRGEIWTFDGGTWTQLDSPTNVVLERVLCVPSGEVYACGQAGTILRGGRQGWSVVEQSATEDDFWGMTWYEQRLWLATLDSVYVLPTNGPLGRVDMGQGAPLSCGWLDAGDGVLWSVGAEDLAYFDGQQWIEVILA